MRLVFGVGHAAVADFEHVGFVPMSGFGVLLQVDLLNESQVRHGGPRIANVAGGAPEVAAHFRAPLPDLRVAVLAEAINNGPSGSTQRVAHLLVYGLHFVVGIEVPRPAPVVLQVIDAPRSPGLSVLLFMTESAFVAGAGIWSGGRVKVLRE